MTASTNPEVILRDLGVSKAGDIELDAIALTMGVRVRYQPLDGCEARIVGAGNSAIVTVNSASPRGRQRFSLAHELGHWMKHRGRRLICRADQLDGSAPRRRPEETQADAFASALVLPGFLLREAVAGKPRLTLDVVKPIADSFQVSLSAAASGLVSLGSFPSLIVCHVQSGRKWFKRSPSIPDCWFPKDALDAESSAMSLLYGQNGSAFTGLQRVSASRWFDTREASGRFLYEQSFRPIAGEVISILQLDDMKRLS